MALVPSNVTLSASFTDNVELVDVLGFDGTPVSLAPGVATNLLALAADEDLAKSAHLKNLQADGHITVNATFDTANTQAAPGGSYALKDVQTAAAASTQTAAADAVATSQPAANVQTGAYVQADVQSIADIANDLKTQYDLAVTLMNELKADYNAAQLEIAELRSIVDNMNA